MGIERRRTEDYSTHDGESSTRQEYQHPIGWVDTLFSASAQKIAFLKTAQLIKLIVFG